MSKMKYSGIEWIGDIPIDWKVNRLRYNCTFKTGGTPPDKYGINTESDGYPWITAQDMNNGIILKKYSQYISEESRRFCNYKLFPKDSILLVCIASVGKVGYLLEPAYSNQQITALMSKKNVFAKYLLYLITSNSPTIVKEASSSVVPIINTQYLSNIYCCMPNMKEQKLIANFLDEKVLNLDKILVDLNKQLEILDKYKKSVITEAVTNGLDKDVILVKSGINLFAKMPNMWKTYRLKDLVSIVRGGSPRPIDDYLSTDEKDINWIKIGDTRKGYKYVDNTFQKIIKSGASKSRKVYKGDLLLTNSMSYGQPYILNIDGCIHDGWLAFSNYNGIIRDYLYYLLMSDLCIVQFEHSAIGAVVDNLNIDKVSSTKVFIPLLEEQKEIVDYLDKKCEQIDKIIEEKQKQIEKIEEYKKSVIYEYVTGKKRVEGAEELYG